VAIAMNWSEATARSNNLQHNFPGPASQNPRAEEAQHTTRGRTHTQEGHMNSALRTLEVLLAFATLSITSGFAQKVKVEYDKSIDFSKYRSFTLQEPAATPSRPLLYASVMGSIKEDLQAKGLTSTEKNGDLTVIPAGGLGYDLGAAPQLDNSCPNCKAPALDVKWPAYMAPPGGALGAPLPKGTLALTMVDRANNSVVWSGTVTQKLNPEKKDKSLQKIYAALNKLLMEFPPGKK
jgi:hypothetical protein